MTADMAILMAMLLLDGMLAGILFVAWRAHGRALHVGLWALGLGLLTIGWGSNIVYKLDIGAKPFFFALVTALEVISAALFAAGFRWRGQVPLNAPLLANVAAAGVIAILAVAFPFGNISAMLCVPQLFRVAMIGFAVSALSRPQPPRALRPEERGVRAFLLAFAGYDLLVAAGALGETFSRWSGWPVWTDMIQLGGLPTAFGGLGIAIVWLVYADAVAAAHREAACDPLTNLLNRRGFDAEAGAAIDRAREERRPLALTLIDLDRFKAINDRFGHAAGDRALLRVADILRSATPPDAIVARLGGEEFGLVGQEDEEAAQASAERLRRRIERASFEGSEAYGLTASIGIARHDGQESLAALLDRADDALYRAKQEGRNRVRAASPAPAPVRGGAAR